MKHGLFLAILFLTIIPCQSQNKEASPPKSKGLNGRKIATEFPADFELTKDLIYRETEEKKLSLDIVWKKEGPPTPLAIEIHGRAGKKEGHYGMGIVCSRNGIAYASIDYTEPTAEDPKMMNEEAVDAVKWLRTHAKEYNLDPNHFAVWGLSRGGYIATHIALKNEKDAEVQAVIIYCTSYGLNRSNNTSPMLDNIKPGLPPFLFVYGDQDKLAPLADVEVLITALKKVGVETELTVIKGARHMFVGEDIQPTLDEVDEITANFLKKHLKPVSLKEQK